MADNTPSQNITVAKMTVKGITRYTGATYDGNVNAKVIFKPYAALGDIWVDRQQIPIVIQSVEGVIENGVLKDTSGNIGVKLYASTPEGDVNIDKNQWTAIFLNVTVDGKPALMNEILFDAKSNDYAYLEEYIPVPGIDNNGIARGPRGTVIDSFTVEGSELVIWELLKDGSRSKIDSVDLSEFSKKSAEIGATQAVALVLEELITYQTNAKQAEQTAKQQATIATSKAVLATNEANRARTEADRATNVVGSTRWDGDKLVVNGITSPSLTGPKGTMEQGTVVPLPRETVDLSTGLTAINATGTMHLAVNGSVATLVLTGVVIPPQPNTWVNLAPIGAIPIKYRPAQDTRLAIQAYDSTETRLILLRTNGSVAITTFTPGKTYSSAVSWAINSDVSAMSGPKGDPGTTTWAGITDKPDLTPLEGLPKPMANKIDVAALVADNRFGLAANHAYSEPSEEQVLTMVSAAMTLARGIKPTNLPVGAEVFEGYSESAKRNVRVLRSRPKNSLYWGLWVFPVDFPVSGIVEAPHPVFDEGSDDIATQVWQRSPAGTVLAVAGSHRTNPDGTDVRDVAHNTASMWHKVTTKIAQSGLPELQLHGFGDASMPGVGAVVSSGSSPLSAGVIRTEAFIAAAGITTARQWDGSATKLIGMANIQGDAAAVRGNPFLHIELSKTVRDSPQNLVDAIVAAGFLTGENSALLTNEYPKPIGSANSRGSSMTAARADHTHRLVQNDPVDGDVVVRQSGGWRSVPVSQIVPPTVPIQVVTALPASPDPNTLYLVKGA